MPDLPPTTLGQGHARAGRRTRLRGSGRRARRRAGATDRRRCADERGRPVGVVGRCAARGRGWAPAPAARGRVERGSTSGGTTTGTRPATGLRRPGLAGALRPPVDRPAGPTRADPSRSTSASADRAPVDATRRGSAHPAVVHMARSPRAVPPAGRGHRGGETGAGPVDRADGPVCCSRGLPSPPLAGPRSSCTRSSSSTSPRRGRRALLEAIADAGRRATADSPRSHGSA